MAAPDSLQSLARLYNLQTTYYDGLGRLRKAPPEAIVAVLRSLGAELTTVSEAPAAFRARRQALWRRTIEPITVAWQHRPLRLKLRVPVEFIEAPVGAQVELEDGAVIACPCRGVRDCAPVRRVEGTAYATRGLLLESPLPLGNHELRLRLGDRDLTSKLIVAPERAYAPPRSDKRWGVFCPLYALHSANSWGAGDFSDLAKIAQFIGEQGGAAVATLPMLPAFLDEPFNPSPYAPVSRLFWNEFYLDILTIPEFAASSAARALVDSDAFHSELKAVRSQSLIDYRRIAVLKRRVIEMLIAEFWAAHSARRQEFEAYIAARPRLHDYASFRATTERDRRVWLQWPEPQRSGTLTDASYEESAKRYHLYVQWLCDQQIESLHNRGGSSGAALYLDFPLGVNRDSYDVWRNRDLFALEASGGAPPDGLFLKGQNWGFPPHHPAAMRRDGYRYYRECLRHHLRHASMLRIDHVMGLHRAFWVPEGFSAADGLYVHQRAEEYYAVLSLESHRHRTTLIGENLGTVPEYVNDALQRHSIVGMHVGQFGVGTEPARAIEAAPENTVASLNTHDTPTFMSFWNGADIDDRLELGLTQPEQAGQEHAYRREQRAALRERFAAASSDEVVAGIVLRGWLQALADGRQPFLLINLEDLWLETLPQNVPGTWQERPNWQRKARYSLEEFCAQPELAELLRRISDIRRAIG